MQSTRSLWAVALLSLLGMLLILGWAQTSRAAAPLDADQIKAVLHTSGVEEEGFVEQAVELVNAGTLPRSIFDSCYLWARKKPRHQFQYFKRALIIRAGEVGVQLG
jgi:hypothetical protein